MHSIKTASAAALVLAGLLAFTAAKAEESNIAIVNGIPISQARLEYVVKAQVAQGQKDDEALRKNVKDALIMREILSQEAIKKGLDSNPEYLTQMEMAKQEFLIRAYFDDFIKENPITDDEMKAEYERVKTEQLANSPGKEFKARHVLIKNEKQAKAALAEINKAKGKNFAAVAKKRSEDSGSKDDGGALDWSDGTNFVKEFGDVLPTLKKGEYTRQLVKTQYGYHVIMMDDVRDVQFPAFEDVKERLYQQMLTQKRDGAIAKLREGAKIE
ncbi:MAG: peptidylprolyl isomerase [Burkholderiales bacterium]|nr:peptidylprolyl isomerase [Burkholderiales bacterium]